MLHLNLIKLAAEQLQDRAWLGKAHLLFRTENLVIQNELS